jgi:hypothetical protein
MSEASAVWRAARGTLWLAVLAGVALGALSTPRVAAAAAEIAPPRAASGAAQPTEAAEDIRDIRGPKLVPGSWVLAALLTGSIVVALSAYAIWRRHHRATLPRPLTLSEQALERLEGIRPLMLPATAREFGIAASEVIRNYIEKRFDAIATQRTTEEFLQDLMQSSNDTLARYRPLLAEFLQQCDFVKFAGVSLAVEDMESLLQIARSFVLETGQPAAV